MRQPVFIRRSSKSVFSPDSVASFPPPPRPALSTRDLFAEKKSGENVDTFMPTASISDTSLANPEKRQNPGGGALYQIKLQKNPQDEYIYDEERRFESQTKKRFTQQTLFVNHVDTVLKFGAKNTIHIPNDNDILGKCHIEIELPALPSGRWASQISKILIRKFVLRYGEQILFNTERLYTDILEKMACPSAKRDARMIMGSVDTKQGVLGNRLILIPLDIFDLRQTRKNHFLPTYFSNNDRIAIDLFIEEFENCIESNESMAPLNEIEIKFVYETAVLNSIDRNDILYTQKTFLVDKIADSEATTHLELSDGTVTVVKNVTVRLNEINFPVSHLVFVAYVENTLFEYIDIIDSYALFLDGNERLKVVDTNENNVQKYENFRKNSGENIGLISFATNAMSSDPSGFCDFSKFKSKELKFQLKREQPGVTIKVFAAGFSCIRYERGQIGMMFD